MKKKSIADRLDGQFPDFLTYCRESGKIFPAELDAEDFIAYRAEHSAPHEEIARLKKLLAFRNKKRNAAANFADNKAELPLQNLFGVQNCAPLENLSLAELNLPARVRHLLERNGYETIADILRATRQNFFAIQNFARASFDKLVAALKNFFAEHTEIVDDELLSTLNTNCLDMHANGNFEQILSKSVPNGNFHVNSTTSTMSNFTTHDGQENEHFRPVLDLADNIFDKVIRPNLTRRGKETLTFKCSLILKERFPNGYNAADENSHSRFGRYFLELFGEKTTLTKKNVDLLMSRVGVLCDSKKYIHPDFVHVPVKILERVKDFVDRADRTAISYKEIFESLKNLFADTQITNRYFLQGVMKLYGLPYTFRQSYLTKADAVDLSKEFGNFVAERGEVSSRELKSHFVAFNSDDINLQLARCPEVFRIGKGKFMHCSRLNLRGDDFAPIRKFLRQNCSKPVTARALFELFSERFAEFATRNEIYSPEKLFGVLQFMFRAEFNFSRSFICTADVKHFTVKKFLLQLLHATNEIELEDLAALCEENGIRVQSKNHLSEMLRPEFLRINEFVLRRTDSLDLTEKIIADVAQNLQATVKRSGGWLLAKNFDDYEWLPQLGVPWNSFLLESIAALNGDKAPRTLRLPTGAVNFSSAIFVSADFADYDFHDFLTKILIDEHRREPFRNERDILTWLRTQGLCTNLPHFLADGRAFNLLNE